MEAFVYKWTDSSNRKMYIGSHKGTVDDGYIGSGKHFKRAYNKRPEVFSREILYVGTYEDVLELEEFILTELNAANNDEYYNLKNSAVGGITFIYERTEKHRKLLSEQKRGNNYAVGTKHDHNGDKNPYYGIRKKVYCEFNGKIYKDRIEAAKDLGYASAGYISRMIRGERKNKYGLKYID